MTSQPAPSDHQATMPLGRADDVVAAVDIGTNSLHLVVARALPSRRFQVLTTEKEMVRLGSGSGEMKHLEPDAMDRGVRALERFRHTAAAHGARLRAVATSAVREAENRNEFLERCRKEAGVDVEVISGVEEARLIHLGVLQALPVYDRQILCFDIGGGSTEFVIGKGPDVLLARSLKVGAIRLTDRFFPTGDTDPSSLAHCRAFLRSFLAPLASEVHALGFETAVASSGTAECVVAVAAAAVGDAPRNLNGFTVDRQALGDAVGRLTAATTPAERMSIRGVDARRADILAAGAVWLDVICDSLGISELTISEYALREGVLLDQLRSTDGPHDGLHHLSDLRRASVEHLLDQFETDRAHALWTTELALQLFDQTRSLHGLDERSIDYLEAGGLLANVGQCIAHSGHHKHSYYLIRNSEHLTGFTSREIELIAQVARYHRRSPPKPSHAEFAALDADDQQTVRILAGLLRVGIGLDRGHRWAVQGVRGRRGTDGRFHIVALADDPDRAQLELYSADARKGLLEFALGVDLELSVE
ncbi:MAG: Ppx/GppA family phosphatase [Acidimicrobiia bacterium]|nr:Ppx/GppA family phosphatase [Acidimicrobiia bacterium]